MVLVKIDAGLLLLIPATLATAFMLWALWNFWKAAKRP
jgi:hypothetical protein